MECRVDWREHPAMVVWTDDWNMCAWAPNLATYEATRHLAFMQTRWSSGTLETAAEADALFDVLRRHASGDGLSPVFEAYYVVGNPDFDAIEADKFQAYHDVGIDTGVPGGWERGPFLEVARTGIAEGIWRPEYHFRSHHFSSEAWMRRLRAGEDLARSMFDRRMYVYETVPNRTKENDQPGPEPFSWIRTGVERFERAFGYRPVSIRNLEQGEEAIAAAGIRTYVNRADIDGRDAIGQRSKMADLFYIGSYGNFEPFMVDDMIAVRDDSLAYIDTRLRMGLPVMLSSHRRNYASFAGDVERNLACLDDLLGTIQRRYPTLCYLISDEVRQLWETGVSLRLVGPRAIARNWSKDDNHAVEVPLPASYRATAITALDGSGSETPCITGDARSVLVPHGNYSITMEQEEHD